MSNIQYCIHIPGFSVKTSQSCSFRDMRGGGRGPKQTYVEEIEDEVCKVANQSPYSHVDYACHRSEFFIFYAISWLGTKPETTEI